jgi:flavin reductase (DIM6/NTAB) family NADH-FMN oxidoreductase RutF
MTCSALCSVAVEPPTLLVGMRGESRTLRAVLDSGRFTVNLLQAVAQDVAELFASGDAHRFDRAGWALPANAAGPHLVKAAHSVADCRVGQMVRVGHQRIVFGEVYRITRLADPEPLLYGLRCFNNWPGTGIARQY